MSKPPLGRLSSKVTAKWPCGRTKPSGSFSIRRAPTYSAATAASSSQLCPFGAAANRVVSHPDADESDSQRECYASEEHRKGGSIAFHGPDSSPPLSTLTLSQGSFRKR